jgi:hypothetical protein
MDKSDTYIIIKQFNKMIMNSDFLKFKYNRNNFQSLLTNWQRKLDMKCDEADHKRADEELARVQPQLDVINKVFNEVTDIMFGPNFLKNKVTSDTVSDRFSSERLNMAEIEKPIMFKIVKENDYYPIAVEALRTLAEKENQ